MEILNNSKYVFIIIVFILLFVYIIIQQKKQEQIEKQVRVLNDQNVKLLVEKNTYINNGYFTERLLSFHFILINILISKLGAKAEGFTYRTFGYKKENGVTIEKRQDTKKVTVKGEVGYIIDDAYFIKKENLDKLLVNLRDVIQKEKEKNIAIKATKDYYKILQENPELFHIEVEYVRGEAKYVLNKD